MPGYVKAFVSSESVLKIIDNTDLKVFVTFPRLCREHGKQLF